MIGTQHYFITTLLRGCIILGMLPVPAQAQLFGGMIKAKKPVAIVIPATITLAQSKAHFVASVYDVDYLPYTVPTVAATTATKVANGVVDPTVNYQGTITTEGVTVSIPTTATGSGTLPAYSTTATIPAALTEDGISRDLTLSWASTAYTTATKSITATIAAVGATLNVKKLDINAGIGNDYLGVLLGAFTYPYNNAGTITTYSVRAISGIPDKMFGLADNGGVVRHNFLYLPIRAEDGKIWLNNNLGADYANVNKASFNPGQQATASNDYHAYGSLFQWGRKPDGHELMNWLSSSSVSEVNGYVENAKSDNPTTPKFISVPNSDWDDDWSLTRRDYLWDGVNAANNPCPQGFRVPTTSDFTTLRSAVGQVLGMSTVTRLLVCGVREEKWVGFGYGFYWSANGYTGAVSPGSSIPSYSYDLGGSTPLWARKKAAQVRCLKD